jgi:hypothetical protein
MDLRDSKSRLLLIAVALGAALVVAVASCGGGGDDGGGSDDGNGETSQTPAGNEGDTGSEGEDEGSEAEEPEEPLAEVTGGEELTLTVTSAERESGGFLTVEGTIYNGGDETFFDLTWAGPETELEGNGFSMAGATLTARNEAQRYLILRDTTGRCLCTGFGNGLEPDATVSWFAQFPEPDATTAQADFQVGNLPPATIEIR